MGEDYPGQAQDQADEERTREEERIQSTPES